MQVHKRTIAAAQLVLICPAVLFMAALLVRSLQPLQYEPAHTAQQIVMWYAARGWTLWVLLVSLPLAAFVIGCITLLGNWISKTVPRQATLQQPAGIRLHVPTLIIAAATLAAGVILVIVVIHMLMN